MPALARSAAPLTPPRYPPTHAPQERVAQLVEHLTFNQVVLGSSPSALTNIINNLAQKFSESFASLR